MAFINFNGQLIPDEEACFSVENRAFQYGDGLFETIIFERGKILLLPYHWERLTRGLEVLHLTAPDHWSREWFEHEILDLIKKNVLEGRIRIKFQIWRRPGGLYTPDLPDADFFIRASVAQPMPSEVKNAGFAQSIQLVWTPISQFKTISALPYVCAGIEKKERGLDDLILLDVHKHVSECIYRNLFWKRGKIIYTPALETGCVAGVMREHLMHSLPAQGFIVEEGRFDQDHLLEAEQVFTTNATGIYAIRAIEGRSFDTDLGWLRGKNVL